MTSQQRQEHLQTRFKFARAFVSGELDIRTAAEEVARGLNVSVKTLHRDVTRARRHQRFDEWCPRAPGPKPGDNRTPAAAIRLIELAAYENADQKPNRAKQARDTRHRMHKAGLPSEDIKSHSTIKRRIAELEARDRSFFTFQRHGREGTWSLEVQRGAIETERPLQVVQMDHQRLDSLVLTSDREGYVIRPWVTAGVDIHTGACVTALLVAGTPSSPTIALAVALMGVSKTAMLRALGVPGTWEEGGIPEVLHVDRGKDFKAEALRDGAARYGTEVHLEYPYSPWRKGCIERFWRTLNSDIHTWPGTTLSNPQDLKRHRGRKPVTMTFAEAQRRLLLAVMEYNHETYDGSELPPVAEWAKYVGTPVLARRVPQDPQQYFIDLLPSTERDLEFQGITFKRCRFNDPMLAALRHSGVKRTQISFDPRDLSHVWIPGLDGRHIKIPRVYPSLAPIELWELDQHNKRRAKAAETARDGALLAEIHAAKQRRLPRFSRPLNEDPPTADGAGLHEPTPPAGSVAGYLADLSDPEVDPDAGTNDATNAAPEAGETPIEPKTLRGRLT
ncbi:MAG: Mu transposase C-terminal domain-containing protein [Pseudomonadota bacterium]